MSSVHAHVGVEGARTVTDAARTPGAERRTRAGTGRLGRALMEASASATWREAVREWRVLGCMEDDSCSGICVCGQTGLRYLFEISNLETGQTLFPIGSVCVRAFESPELDREARRLWRLLRLADEEARGGPGRIMASEGRLLTRPIVDCMLEGGAFGAGASGQADYERLRAYLEARRKSEGDRREARDIIERRVCPYLRDLRRRALSGVARAAPPHLKVAAAAGPDRDACMRLPHSLTPGNP